MDMGGGRDGAGDHKHEHRSIDEDEAGPEPEAGMKSLLALEFGPEVGGLGGEIGALGHATTTPDDGLERDIQHRSDH